MKKNAKCTICRRMGSKLMLKGVRCEGPKCAFSRRSYAPGQVGMTRRRITEFGLQLREKQKARAIYGVSEEQFRKYYDEASRKKGVAGELLLQILETRLDNVVFRLGLASSRATARELVTHGHFKVNGRKTDIPSRALRIGDTITLRVPLAKKKYFADLAEQIKDKDVVSWLKFNSKDFSAEVIALPAREQMELGVDEQLIIEYYSR